MIETFELRGHTLEYDDDYHLYIVDGIEVPSVTQILKTKFPAKYANVDRATLDNAARLGTKLHKAIEDHEAGREVDSSDVESEFAGYLDLKEKYEFKVIRSEVPVLIPYESKIVAAGRLDMIFEMDGQIGIADIKRTYKLDKQYLAWQLALYSIGYRYTYGEHIETHRCLHLRKEVADFVKIQPANVTDVSALLKEVANETGQCPF
jgi:hypothetical protein